MRNILINKPFSLPPTSIIFFHNKTKLNPQHRARDCTHTPQFGSCYFGLTCILPGGGPNDRYAGDNSIKGRHYMTKQNFYVKEYA